MKLYPSFHSPEVNPSYPADFSIFAFVMALLFSIISSGSDVWVNNCFEILSQFEFAVCEASSANQEY